MTNVPADTNPPPALRGFNSDLLVDPVDLDLARRRYPSIFYALDHPELRAEFLSADAAANAAKRGTQKAGALAVVLAGAALGISTAAPIWHATRSPWPTLLAGLAALLSLFATAMAIGILQGERKDLWLRNRFRTERIRQFYFQTLVLRIDSVAKASTNARAAVAFAKERQTWFEAFRRTLDDSGPIIGSLNEILDANVSARPWVHSVRSPTAVPPNFDTAELFAAYLDLRLDAQLAYANRVLSKDTWTVRFRRLSLLQQRDVLNISWIVAVVALVGLHVWILWNVATFREFDGTLEHVAVIWFALLALVARTIQHGLCLPSDVERYSDYRSEVKTLRDTFAHPSATPTEKLEVMIAMERASFEEMRRFIRARREASFVL